MVYGDKAVHDFLHHKKIAPTNATGLSQMQQVGEK